MRGTVTDVIARLLEAQAPFSSTEVALAAGVSRQAAHKHLRRLVREGRLSAEGRARACRYRQAIPPPVPLRRRLEVASAGSLFRLSARLLLEGVEAGEVVLDFTGVEAVGEEFLEEIFFDWAPAHSHVTLRIEHVPARFAPMLLNLAKRGTGSSQPKAVPDALARRLESARARFAWRA